MAKFTSPKDRAQVDDLNEGAEQTDDAPVSQVTKLEPPKITPPAMSLEALQAFASAMGGEFASALKQVLDQNATTTADVVKAARSRRPESYNGDFPYPGKSVFAPEGLAALPNEVLPKLKCPMFLGIWENNKAVPVYPYIADDTGGLTLEERDLLNQLKPGLYTVERRDEITGPVRVVIDEDADGTPTRLTIAVQKNWLEKGEVRSLPSIKVLARQLLEQQKAVSAA